MCLALLLTASLIGYLANVAGQIERQSTVDEAQPADVIIVLGAAEYRGKPSPVLQARLNHALKLYLQDLAPYVMTTGGAGGDPNFTEGEKGSTTAQSLEAAAETMHRMNLSSCIVVSDGYHIYRVKRLLQAQKIKVYGSPRPGSLDARDQRWLYWKQAAGFALWQAGINI